MTRVSWHYQTTLSLLGFYFVVVSACLYDFDCYISVTMQVNIHFVFILTNMSIFAVVSFEVFILQGYKVYFLPSKGFAHCFQ